MVTFMLEHIKLEKPTIKNQFKDEIKALQHELSTLQLLIKEKGIPVIVIMEGWSASGKGSMISKLISELDPRSFNVFSTESVDETEKRHPFLWRYWKKLPKYGRLAILDRSWYREISTNRIENKLSDEEVNSKIESINIFERQLVDDGYVIVKFFLHISKAEQRKRLEKLNKNKNTSWRVTNIDLNRNKNYEKYYKAFDEMCINSNSNYAPWHILGCHDKNSATLQMFKTMVTSIKNAIEGNITRVSDTNKIPKKEFVLLNTQKLSDINLNKSLTDDEYESELEFQQKLLFKLQNKLYRKKIPVTIAFEGWDAAGKGGAIKRIAASLDPRGYEAIPVAAPSTEELAHHYLWRFWSKLPKSGHLGIFDRSWYGRVMVERVEGFAPVKTWQRAFQEINEFEDEITKSGGIVVKFWLQISKDEQLLRFNDRKSNPEKMWKITDEDWRNREKWDSYEVAVDEMMEKTSTKDSPWNIIEANDKKFARIKVIKTLNNILLDRIDKK